MTIGKHGRYANRCRGAHQQALLTAQPSPGLLGNARQLNVTHPGANCGDHGLPGFVLHARSAPHEIDFLGAFARLDPIHRIGEIHPASVCHLATAQVFNQRMRYCTASEQTNRACGIALKGRFSQCRIVGIAVAGTGIARRAQHPTHPTAQIVLTGFEIARQPKGPLRDERHRLIARKDHRHRIAVGSRYIGKVFDIAAHEIVVGLHQQHIDLLLGHCGAHQPPAPLQFRG